VTDEPADLRLAPPRDRERGLPSERDWERSPVLEPRLGGREADLISDGVGLPFPPAVLAAAPGGLDPADPAVVALIAQLTASSARRGSRLPWKRSEQPPPVPASLDQWRQLARSDDEVLFARGSPPRLHTVTIRRGGRRQAWAFVGDSGGRPLRATRELIRASSWRLDPTHELADDERTLRILLTEQTFSGGERATNRVLAPDLHVGTDELVLRMFVTPRAGFQMRSPNPETAVRVALPEPIGSRRLIDGALFEL
jgi:hypothetical protein